MRVHPCTRAHTRARAPIRRSHNLAGARAQLLLGYLPAERSAWAATLASQRQLYSEWKAELMVDPSKRPADPLGGPAPVAPDAHPLTSAANSPWSAFFQNEELFHEIQKDVSRTLPDYGFYASETPSGDAHRTAILQVLFVYAKLNPGIRYVQGMNELLAPLFFLLVTEAAVGGGGTGLRAASGAAGGAAADSGAARGDAAGGSATGRGGAGGVCSSGASGAGTGVLIDLLAADAPPAQAPAAGAAHGLGDLAALDGAVETPALAGGGSGQPRGGHAEESPCAAAGGNEPQGGQPLLALADLETLGAELRALGAPRATSPLAHAHGGASALAGGVEDDGGATPLGCLEADAFFLFTNLMAETRDSFCQSLDSSDVGVKGTIAQLSALLAVADPELHAHLAAEKVSAQFFSFRWLTLLLSQEFDLPDVLRIWDSFFADANRFRFVLFWCLAMLEHVREVLLSSDFAHIIKTLQRYPEPDVVALHRLASRLYAQDKAGILGHEAPAPRPAVAHEPAPPMAGLAAAAAAVRRKAEDVLAGAGGGAPRRRNGPATSVEC